MKGSGKGCESGILKRRDMHDVGCDSNWEDGRKRIMEKVECDANLAA